MATTEEIRAQLAELVNDVAGVPVEDVQLDKSFVDDLDVDSLAMVEIIVGCEEKFGVTIPDEESKNLKTVGDAVAYIEQHSGPGRTPGCLGPSTATEPGRPPTPPVPPPVRNSDEGCTHEGHRHHWHGRHDPPGRRPGQHLAGHARR